MQSHMIKLHTGGDLKPESSLGLGLTCPKPVGIPRHAADADTDKRKQLYSWGFRRMVGNMVVCTCELPILHGADQERAMCSQASSS